MTYKNRLVELQNDETTSYWLKDAINDLDRKDVVDVLNELEVLKDLFNLKFQEVKA